MIGYKTISLKTRNYSDAKAKAKGAYLRFSQMVKEGASLGNRTFDQAWRSWYEAMVAQNAWSDMGTSIEQLVAHYDWATTEQRAAEITKTKWEQKKKRVDQLLADLTEAEKVELKRQLQAEDKQN
jgi:hypothetical protein